MTAGRHLRRVPGGIALSAAACESLLGLLDDPGRLAALAPLGSEAASLIGLVGRTYSVRPVSDTGPDQPSHVDSEERSPRELLDLTAAAELLHCTPRHVRRHIAAGRLPAQRIGQRTLAVEAGHVHALRRAG